MSILTDAWGIISLKWKSFQHTREIERYLADGEVYRMINPTDIWALYTTITETILAHLEGKVSLSEKDMWLRFRMQTACLTRLSEIEELVRVPAPALATALRKFVECGDEQIRRIRAIAMRPPEGVTPYLGTYEWTL